MKFEMRVKDERHPDGWTEHFDRPEVTTQEQAEAWARMTIDVTWNGGLRDGELPRTFISATITGENTQHDWHKTNLSTIVDPRLGVYDVMRCDKCGITGKRFGLGQAGVKRDSKFRAMKYETCTGGNA